MPFLNEFEVRLKNTSKRICFAAESPDLERFKIVNQNLMLGTVVKEYENEPSSRILSALWAVFGSI